MDQPFAAVADIEAVWHPLLDQQADTASKLLDYASNKIRVRWPDIDDRLAAGTVSALTLEEIVVGMVKRAMLTTDGLASQQQAAGPFSVNQTYSNPNGNLYLSKDDVALIEPKVSGKAFAVDLSEPCATGGDFYGRW